MDKKYENHDVIDGECKELPATYDNDLDDDNIGSLGRLFSWVLVSQMVIACIVFVMAICMMNKTNRISRQMQNESLELREIISEYEDNQDTLSKEIKAITEEIRLVNSRIEKTSDENVNDESEGDLVEENIDKVTVSVDMDNSVEDTLINDNVTKVVGKRLYDLKMVETKGVEAVSKSENTLGDEIKDAIVGQGWYEVYVTYYLGGKYTTLEFELSCLEDARIGTSTTNFSVLGDKDVKKTLYSTDLGRAFAVEPISLDVSGLDFVTFKAGKRSASVLKGFIISNTNLY